MTTPQEPPVDEPTASEVEVVAALLAVGAGIDATAKAIAAVTGIGAAAVLLALTRQGYKPALGSPTRTGGTAERIMDGMNELRAAAYTIKSARRIEARVRRGMGEEQAQEAEGYLYEQHRRAMARRVVVGRRIDAAAAVHGPLLGWYAKHDSRTSPDCRDADGKNFLVAWLPAIGYPGMVHPNCRCVAGPPHPGAPVFR